MRLVVGLTGSSGMLYGVRMLEVLKRYKVVVHLIMTEWGKKCLTLETDYDFNYVRSLASHYSDDPTLAPRVSSGTHKTDGIIIIPYRFITLSRLNICYAYTLSNHPP